MSGSDRGSGGGAIGRVESPLLALDREARDVIRDVGVGSSSREVAGGFGGTSRREALNGGGLFHPRAT